MDIHCIVLGKYYDYGFGEGSVKSANTRYSISYIAVLGVAISRVYIPL